MAIESKDLLVAIKAFSRANPLPIDASEVHDSLDAAQKYAASAKAYAGQTIKVLQNGVYQTYVLNPGKAGLELKRVDIEESALKNYVQVVETLPTTGQEQGVIYIDSNLSGQIWTGSEWLVVFEQIQIVNEDGETEYTSVSEAIEGINNEIVSIQESLDVLNGDASIAGSVDYKIAEAIINADHLKRVVVDALPDKNIDANTIYMLANGLTGSDIYDEYMYINGKWERLGNTQVDLTDYYTKAEVDNTFATIAALADYAKKSELPVVPTNVSAFVNDAGYLTEHQDLSEYAKKSEIPTDYLVAADLNGYATESYVDEAVKGVDVSEQLKNYALKTDIPSDYLVAGDLADYATQDWVTNEINNAQLGGGDSPDIDLSIYALKSDLGEIGNVTVKEYVDVAIANAALNVVEF